MGSEIVVVLLGTTVFCVSEAVFWVLRWNDPPPNHKRQPAASKKMANGNSSFIETDVRIFPKNMFMTRRKQKAASLPMPVADGPFGLIKQRSVVTQREASCMGISRRGLFHANSDEAAVAPRESKTDRFSTRRILGVGPRLVYVSFSQS